MKMKKMNVLYLGLCVLLMASCAVRKSAGNAAELVAKQWRLVELDGKPVAEKVNGKMPFLEFDAESGRYSASGGCNGVGGEYTLAKDNSITFGRGMSTMMACPDMSVEQGLRALFENADHYALESEGLTLTNKESGKVLAKFVAVAK